MKVVMSAVVVVEIVSLHTLFIPIFDFDSLNVSIGCGSFQ